VIFGGESVIRRSSVLTDESRFAAGLAFSLSERGARLSETRRKFGGVEREQEFAGFDGLTDGEIRAVNAAHDAGGEGGALERVNGSGERLGKREVDGLEASRAYLYRSLGGCWRRSIRSAAADNHEREAGDKKRKQAHDGTFL
jgi:hypothetical protein